MTLTERELAIIRKRLGRELKQRAETILSEPLPLSMRLNILHLQRWDQRMWRMRRVVSHASAKSGQAS